MAKYLIEMRPNADDRYLGEGDTMLGAIPELVMLIIKNSFVCPYEYRLRAGWLFCLVKRF